MANNAKNIIIIILSVILVASIVFIFATNTNHSAEYRKLEQDFNEYKKLYSQLEKLSCRLSEENRGLESDIKRFTTEKQEIYRITTIKIGELSEITSGLGETINALETAFSEYERIFKEITGEILERYNN